LAFYSTVIRYAVNAITDTSIVAPINGT